MKLTNSTPAGLLAAAAISLLPGASLGHDGHAGSDNVLMHELQHGLLFTELLLLAGGSVALLLWLAARVVRSVRSGSKLRRNNDGRSSQRR